MAGKLNRIEQTGPRTLHWKGTDQSKSSKCCAIFRSSLHRAEDPLQMAGIILSKISSLLLQREKISPRVYNMKRPTKRTTSAQMAQV